jgi:hypothetical protein
MAMVTVCRSDGCQLLPICHVQGMNQRFLNWSSVKFEAYLNYRSVSHPSDYTFGPAPASPLKATPILWCCRALPMIELVSPRYPQITVPCQVITVKPAFPVMTLQSKFLTFLAWFGRSLYTKSQFCLWLSFSRCTNIAVVCLMFKSSHKMHQHISCDRPIMLQISLIVCCLSSWITCCSFSTFSSVWLDDRQIELSECSTKFSVS